MTILIPVTEDGLFDRAMTLKALRDRWQTGVAAFDEETAREAAKLTYQWSLDREATRAYYQRYTPKQKAMECTKHLFGELIRVAWNRRQNQFPLIPE